MSKEKERIGIPRADAERFFRQFFPQCLGEDGSVHGFIQSDAPTYMGIGAVVEFGDDAEIASGSFPPKARLQTGLLSKSASRPQDIETLLALPVEFANPKPY